MYLTGLTCNFGQNFDWLVQVKILTQILGQSSRIGPSLLKFEHVLKSKPGCNFQHSLTPDNGMHYIMVSLAGVSQNKGQGILKCIPNQAAVLVLLKSANNPSHRSVEHPTARI
jgi:hypothetical protein